MDGETILLRLDRDERGDYFTCVEQWPNDVRFDPVPIPDALVQATLEQARSLRESGLLHPQQEAILKLGVSLRQILLPTALLSPLLTLLAARQPLRFALSVAAPELASLPWECLYVDPAALRTLFKNEAFYESCYAFISELGGPFFPFLPRLGQRLAFFRLDPEHAHAVPLQPSNKLRVLCALADPERDLHPHPAAILEPLQALGSRVTFDLLPHARRDTLQERLCGPDPYRVFVFYGHGEYRGSNASYLALESSDGLAADALSIETLSDWLVVASEHPVALVVLIACESGVELAQRLVGAGVPAVVAMQSDIPETDVRTFVEAFFREFVRGSALEDCLSAGRQVLSRQLSGAYVDRFEWAIPILVTGSLHTSLVQPASPLSHIPFVDRERERGALFGLVETVVQGQGRCVFIAGETGVGKTRFVQELIAHARLRAPVCLFQGYCQELQQPTAFYPITEALRSQLPQLKDAQLEQVAPLWLAEVATLVPELRQRLPNVPQNPPLPPEQTRLRQFEGLAQWLLAFSSPSQCVVLFLDDLQWADALSLEFLDYLLPHLRDRRFLVVGTYTPEEGLSEALQTLLRRQRSAHDEALSLVTLQHLPRQATQALLEQLAPTMDGREPFSRRLHEETSGNPLFLVSLLRHCLDTGVVRVKGRRWVLRADRWKSATIPNAIKDVVLQRVKRLDEAPRALLQLAAVLGQGVEFELLQQVWEGKDDALDLLETLVEKQLLQERLTQASVCYDFCNHTFRDVVYESMGLTRRRLLHRHALAALERREADRDENNAIKLAQHAQRAGEHVKALTYALAAVEKSLALYRWQEALELITLGLKSLERIEREGGEPARVADRRFALLSQRVEAFNFQGDRARQAEDLATLASLAQPAEKHKLALIQQKQSALCYQTGALAKAQKTAAEALRLYEQLHDLDGQALCHNHIGNAYHNLGQYERALTWHRKALALRSQQGDARGQRASLNNIGRVYFGLGSYRLARQHYERALNVKGGGEDPNSRASVLNNLGGVHAYLGDDEKALDCYEKALAVFQQIGNRQGEGSSLNNVGNLYQNLGQYGQALAHYERALTLRQKIDDPWGVAFSLSNRGLVRCGLGHYEVALSDHEEALAVRKAIGDRRGQGACLNNLARAYDSLGQYEQALQRHGEALRIRRAIKDRQGEGHSLHTVALIETHLERFEAALSHLLQALAVFEQVGDRRFQGHCCCGLGVVYAQGQQPQKALEQFQRAADIFRALRAKDAEIECLSHQASAQLQRGRNEAALLCSSRALALLSDEVACPTPQRVYYVHANALSANGKEGAEAFVEKAYDEVKRRAERLQDEARRQSFLNVKINRAILDAWEGLKR